MVQWAHTEVHYFHISPKKLVVKISKFSFMGLDFWAMDSAKEGDILLPFVGPNIASHNTDK